MSQHVVRKLIVPVGCTGAIAILSLHGRNISCDSSIPVAIPVATPVAEGISAAHPREWLNSKKGRQEVHRAVLSEINSLTQSEVEKLLAKAKQNLQATVDTQRAALIQAVEHEVQRSNRRIKKMAEHEVSAFAEKHVPEKIAAALRQDVAMKALLTRHLREIDNTISNAAHAALRRIVEEDQYQTVNAALLASLREKLDTEMARAEQRRRSDVDALQGYSILCSLLAATACAAAVFIVAQKE
jgi:hypothetical protein